MIPIPINMCMVLVSGGSLEGSVVCVSTHLDPSFWNADGGSPGMRWSSTLSKWTDTGFSNNIFASSRSWSRTPSGSWSTGYRPDALIITINGGNAAADNGTDTLVAFPSTADVVVYDTSFNVIGSAVVLFTAPSQDVSVAVELTFAGNDISTCAVSFDYYKYNKAVACLQFTDIAGPSDSATEMTKISILGDTFWRGNFETTGIVIGYDDDTGDPIFGSAYWPNPTKADLLSIYAPSSPITKMQWNAIGSWATGYRPRFIGVLIRTNSPYTPYGIFEVTVYSGATVLGSGSFTDSAQNHMFATISPPIYVELDFTGAGDITHMILRELDSSRAAVAENYYLSSVYAYEAV